MKEIIKKIIYTIITLEAKLVLLIYRPKIVAVTGTVGKTSTKDAIYTALASQFRTRRNLKSLNSEIGVPLTILGLESGWNNPLSWIKNIIIGLFRILWNPRYPHWLVLEVGIDRPGDMKKVASWLKPNVAVITAFGDVPVHVEYFDSPEEVMKEKAILLDYLQDDGIIVLNGDDENVLKLKKKAEERVYTYGTIESDGIDMLATNCTVIYEEVENIKSPIGITFKVNYDGNIIPLNIKGVVGDTYIYPFIAALSVGVGLGISIVPMATALAAFQAPPARMRLIDGINDSTIIDDTYNASPIAMRGALQTLNSIETSGMKIAILGDMLEIGRYSSSEHRKVGERVAEYGFDYLISVGLRAELISQAALEAGMGKEKIFHYNTSEEALKKAKEFLQPNNIFLVKGSQRIRTERIVKGLMEDEKNAKKLLVRQEKEWQER